ncbi:MAG: transporter substrate-binding domain-containing protein [Mycobacteriaceae bacterium]
MIGRRAAMAALLGLCLLAAAPPSGADEPELRICTTGDYRPLTFRDPATGQYDGIDIDMARDLAATLGRAPVFVATTWPTLTQDLTTPGRCDIAMGGISITPARRQVGEFTAPYLPSGKVPITQSASGGRFATLDAINQPGVEVIENPGGTNEQFAREHFPRADISIWPDNATIFDELAASHADVMITDAIEARYQAARHPGLVAVNPDQPFTEDAKAYWLPGGSPLPGQVDAWLQKAMADGVFAGFYDRWMA